MNNDREASSRLQRTKRTLARLFSGRKSGARQSLRTTVAILKAQQDSTLDGILVVDTHGRVLSYNRRFLEIWQIPEEVVQRGLDTELLPYARALVEDWNAFSALVQRMYTEPSQTRRADKILLKDGRVLSRATVPVETADGQITGRAWYFRDITSEEHAAQLQAAVFKIAQLSRETGDLDAFYRGIHGVVASLMDARNFYIAEHDEATGLLSFPYYADEYDARPDRPQPLDRGLTAYVLRHAQPTLVHHEDFPKLIATGEVEQVGTQSVDWIGVPLTTGGRTWGVLGTQIYDAVRRYTEREKEILVMVSQHVASAVEHRHRAEALTLSERRYRQMFENNRAVQIVLDPENGAIVDANMAACDFYGYTLEELRSMRIWSINVLGEQRIREQMTQAKAQERSFFVFRHMRANGEIRDVEVHSGPIDSGGRQLLYSIIHDVTERKRAELGLQQSEEKYRNIFRFASVGILQSTRTGHLITANATLARMLGYDSVEELLQTNLMQDVWVDEAERARLFPEGEPEDGTRDVEVRWWRKDGTPIWVQVNAHAVRSAAGTLYYEGFVYDITERKRAEQSLAAANGQRKAVLDAATRVSIIATDPDGLITVFNTGAERMLGFAAEDMIGDRSILELHVPEELAQQGADISATLRRPVGGFDVLVTRPTLEGHEEREWTYIRADGEKRTVVVSVTSLRGDDGAIHGFLHVGTDITDRKQAEEMQRKQSAAMTAAMDGIGILNERLEITYANDALAKLFGYPRPQAMLNRSLYDLYDESEHTKLASTIIPAVLQRGRWRGEATGKRRDGFFFPQEISLTTVEGGSMVCVVRDITERTYAEEQIKHLAYHDALTGLPNRLLFKDRLTVALSHAQRDHNRLAVLFLDLDRFKIINDSLGHNIGDQLLQAVAARVASCVRESDTVARLGGDEFTVLLPSLIRSEDAALVAQKILEAVRYPLHIEGREFFISTSIGISLFPEDGTDAATLIKNSDTAMYQAKEQGRDNYQLFNAFVNAKALQRIALEHGLRRALAAEELELHYQPIFDLRAGRITGVEALLRWQHPEMGTIPPNVFIPIAEATGAMVPIGTWVIRTACRQAQAWHQLGFRHLTLAVNLSVTQLQQSDLVSRVREALEDTGLPARMLELEITESTAMHSPETSIRTLYDLKKLGVRISLDDFGTGHSSLSYLKRFPIDTLKIDQSFVRDINTDPDTAAIVTAIIAMAHSLRLKVIAEGVEFSEQANFLKRYSCDQMQGYLIKPPVPAAEFAELITMTSAEAG